MEHPLTLLSRRYPQLLFPISEGISQTAEYKNAVLCGKAFDGYLDFSMSEKDRLMRIDTPVGAAELLLLHNRKDFEKCACALANKCEPKHIPKTVGAFMISGLTNWEKVRQICEKHTFCCEKDGSVNLNYLKLLSCDFKDKMIILSSGWYSGVAPELLGLSNEAWVEKSVTIRAYHEVTHFVCRTRHPKNIQAIRDEIFADMIGIVAAFGFYDTRMARLFLGVTEAACEEQGRIHYYLKNQEENAVIQEVNFWISWLEQRIAKENQINIDNLITTVFDEMLCME